MELPRVIKTYRPQMLRFFLLSLAMSSRPLLAADSATSQAPKPVYAEVSSVDELLRATTACAKTGGTIHLRPGTYVLDQTLTFKNAKAVYLLGSGWNTLLKKQGDGDALLFEDAAFCVVRDLCIVADPKAKAGCGIVYRGRTGSCTVEFCKIAGFPRDGIRYEGAPNRPMSSNAVRNSHLLGNKEAGLWSCENNDFFIIGNQFGNHDEKTYPQAGCVLDHSSAGTYSMNYHWRNVNALRMVGGCSFNRVENNRFENSQETAVVLGDPADKVRSRYNIFLGNTFHTNSELKFGAYPAMTACNAYAVTFSANQFFTWNARTYKHSHSLVLGPNCGQWLVKDNVFHGNTGEPIVHDEQADILLKDNLTDAPH